MIGISDLPNPMFINQEEVNWQDYMKRQQDLNMIRFERDDLSHRAIYRLQTLLTAEQIEQIGGLPEPSKQPSGRW